MLVGLFGGKSEEELRAGGTPTTARVTYVDDTGKRRDGGAFARVKVRVQIDSGSARGRELEKTKWVPSNRIPHMGEQVQIRFDPDDVSDWAWGDAAMYSPPAPSAPAASPVPQAQQPPPSAAPMFTGFSGGSGFDVDFSIERNHQVIDLTGDSQLRDQILGQLRAYGVDIDAMQAATNSVGAGQPPGGAPAADETAVKLRQLDELHRQGILSDEEHRQQRQRIIDSI